jgi:hypothetical protein
MGFRYRKSIKVGKHARVNLSKSGVGFSVGSKGYRKTYSPNGRTRTTVSVPGTGLSYVTETSTRSSSHSSTTGASTPSSSQRNKVPFFQRTGVIILLLLVFPPAGILLMWIFKKHWNFVAKIILTAFSLFVFVCALSSPRDSTSTADISDNISTEFTTATDTPIEASLAFATETPSPTEEPIPTAFSEETAVSDPTSTPSPTSNLSQVSATYVGSSDSDKYHKPTCRFAKKILAENLIEFTSKEDAEARGYSPCSVCNP